ncbi:adenine nucleotide alpha hydrolases-like protein [Hypomontagnella monticulosa]|nr:adenine nucleotide alpha hydrolases-like protein [Hypomontagnella monticulosa]
MATEGSLNVVALMSGGKDSFYSVLHCLANGHRVVALANLYPPSKPVNAGKSTTSSTGAGAEDGSNNVGDGGTTNTATIRISPGDNVAPQQMHGSLSGMKADAGGDEEDESDLNSFMYQTVGHQVIPLYAQATGIPLFRQPILGNAVDHGISYRDPDGRDQEEDETESLVPLLLAVLRAHPEVNALCTGAILSTYQRTRVESVALRLGLVPLAYLWQFPELPLSSTTSPHAKGTDKPRDDAQLLHDMEAAGLEARIVKVASAGLDEDFLWENAASEVGVSRIRRALRRFGGDGGRGAVLGEGGEFETLVVNGPPVLFKGRIVVDEGNKRIVREGGGSAWLSIRNARVEMKADVSAISETKKHSVRIPNLLDPRFEGILELLLDEQNLGYDYKEFSQKLLPSPSCPLQLELDGFSSQDWFFEGSSGPVEDQITRIVDEIRQRLHQQSLPATAITNSVITLRRMADFPTINKIYGALFREPNPPARVTISCGGHLGLKDADITILLTVQPQMRHEERRGLHVQSRSYWAPANIGPYSQAVSYPLLTNEGRGNSDIATSSLPLAVSVAGQIPLVPASMVLPPGDDNLPLQITLALQHLWRVGMEMGVRWWSSAVAYIPNYSSYGSDHIRAGQLVGSAWKEAHIASPTSTDAVEELDPWDRKHNPLYMTYGDSGNVATATPSLPDWEVLKDFEASDEDGGMTQRPLPFVFLAEVEELPRSAGVEWHAHLGFANLESGSIRLYSVDSDERYPDVPGLHHVIVESPSGDVFVQTVAVYQRGDDEPIYNYDNRIAQSTLAVKGSLVKLLAIPEPIASCSEGEGHSAEALIKPKHLYVDLNDNDAPWGNKSYGSGAISCRSLWDSQGRSLDMVLIYETRWIRR